MKRTLASSRTSVVVRCISVIAVLLLLGCGPRGAPAGQAAHPAADPFSEIAITSGIRFDHRNGQGAAANIVETTGSGCALFDYDNDGWLDIYLINGKSPPGDGNHLYHNNHDGTFTDVTTRAGVAGLGHGFGMGCAAGDYDGDGWMDLYVTYYGKNILYRNRGDGTFEDVTEHAGVAAGGFSTSAVFADLDGDGRPDLYVARYCKFTPQSRQLCVNNGFPMSCPPFTYSPEPDIAYRNMGDGTFKDVTDNWGLTDTTGRGLGVIAVDYNSDGKLDLFVANDGSPNFLYKNLGGGHFESVGAAEGVALTDAGAAVSNMGCDFGDFMADGTLGVMTGVFDGEECPIWRYDRQMGFQYVTRQSGIGPPTAGLLTWGVGFVDMNNDGLLDIFLTNGHVEDHADQIKAGSHYKQPRTFFENLGGGKFVDRTTAGGPALTLPVSSRGTAFGDLFNDGGIDVVVNDSNGPAMLIRNNLPRQHWVELRLFAKGRNWEAIGAVARLKAGGKTLTRFVHTAYSYAAANDSRLHFGLGAGRQVDSIEITWPDGLRTEHRGIPVDQITSIVEDGAQLPAPLRSLAE